MGVLYTAQVREGREGQAKRLEKKHGISSDWTSLSRKNVERHVSKGDLKENGGIETAPAILQNQTKCLAGNARFCTKKKVTLTNDRMQKKGQYSKTKVGPGEEGKTRDGMALIRIGGEGKQLRGGAGSETG